MSPEITTRDGSKYSIRGNLAIAKEGGDYFIIAGNADAYAVLKHLGESIDTVTADDKGTVNYIKDIKAGAGRVVVFRRS